MALPHAHPDDVVDLLPAPGAAPAPVSVSLLRTANLQLLRLVLPAGQRMPEHLVMILALDGARPVAASLLVRDDDRLYGRYWGAVEAVPLLHFETAYYQAIETAIELRIPIIEGGAQGEHKMARGFLPQETVSCHWLAEPAFADAVERFLQREGGMIDGYLDELTERSPLRRSDRG